jgi:hypothetical protein
MSIQISHETEAHLIDEARRQGVSVDALLEQLISQRGATAHIAPGNCSIAKLPILHLGAMGPFHRRDIYDDVS